MISADNFKASYNNLSFNFKTSSGDNISLSMYDNKEVRYGAKKDENGSVAGYSLTHSYGYSFKYSGDGLDEKDKEEIKKAMEEFRPQVKDFMEKVKQSGIPSPKDIAITAKIFIFIIF